MAVQGTRSAMALSRASPVIPPACIAPGVTLLVEGMQARGVLRCIPETRKEMEGGMGLLPGQQPCFEEGS